MVFEYIVPGVISGGMLRYDQCFVIVETLLRNATYFVVNESINNTASKNIIKAHGRLVEHYKVTKDGKDAYVDIRQSNSSDPDSLPHYRIIVNGNDENFVNSVGEILGEIQDDKYNYKHENIQVSTGGRRLKKIHHKRKTRRAKKTRRTRKTRRT